MTATQDTLIASAGRLSELLTARSWKIAAAESCTGGLLASACTSLPGSSAWFWGSFVTYTLDAKQTMLGVPQPLLERWGAVSQPVARAMADGALRRSSADIAVSITGLAGPAGGELDKPVGTVWFGWSLADSEVSRTAEFNLEGDREAVRREATRVALDGAIELLSAPPL